MQQIQIVIFLCFRQQQAPLVNVPRLKVTTSTLWSAHKSTKEITMTQQEFNRLVALDIQRLVAKAQAEYEAQVAAEEAARDSEAAQ